MKTRKNAIVPTEWFSTGCMSTPTASTPSYITAVQPSVVDISKRVCIDLKMLSKFMSLVPQEHSSPSGDIPVQWARVTTSTQESRRGLPKSSERGQHSDCSQ